MSPIDEFALAALRWAVGDQPAEDLPGIAADALVHGMDSPTLRELAGAPRDDHWRIKRLFEVALQELQIALPDEQTALWRLARHIAAEIVAGRVAPEQGARKIWVDISRRVAREGDLRTFIALVSELEDHPELRPELEADIIEAAKKLAGQVSPRR